MTDSRMGLAVVAVWAVSGALAQSSLVQQVAPRLTANALQADVSFLASDALEGRGTPSRGLDIAAEYIAAQFRRAGLEPAGNDGYFADAPYTNVTVNPNELELTFEVGEQIVKVDKASMTLQEPAAVDLAHAPVVAVAMKNRAALDALTAGDVRGKVLLLFVPPDSGYSAMRGIPAVAERLQPALVLLVRARGQGPGSNTRLREASAPSRVPILAVWDPAIRDLVAGGHPYTVSVRIPAPAATPVKLRNVIGILRGSDPALQDTYLLLTAHYDHLGVRGTGEGDHIYNGANDDASGTASVIEIANALAALPTRPKRSIVFLTLFGEELGEVGSHYYTCHPVFPLARTVADLNLEQLGRTDDSQGPHVAMVNLTGFDFTDLPPVFLRAGESAGIRVVNDKKNSDRYFAASDNAAFAEAGVPSTTVSVTYEFPDYHLPGDESSKLDYQNMAKVDLAIALAAYQLADSAAAPQWNASNPKTEPFIKARGK